MHAYERFVASVAKYTISQAVPHLVKLFLNPDEAGNRAPILTLLSDFITAARDSLSKLPPLPAQVEDDIETELTVPPLMPYKDEVLGVLTVGLKAVSSRRSALAGLQGMVTTENLLTDEELSFAVHSVNEVLEANSDEVDDARCVSRMPSVGVILMTWFLVSDAVLDLLSAVAEVNARLVEDQTLPLLFSSLPDTPPARDAIPERVKILNALSALETLCVQSQLFETLVIRLTTKLDLICVPSTSSLATSPGTEEELELYAAYAHWILNTLVKTLQKKVDKGDPDVAKYIERLVPRIFNLFAFAAFVVSDEQTSGDNEKEKWRKRVGVATDYRLVKKAGEIVTLVVQVLPLE